MAFKYRERSTEAIDKRSEQKGGDFEGFISDEFKMYTVKKGDNWIRILPPTWDDPEHYGMDLWVHYGIGADRASIICPAKQPHPMTGEKGRCPICEAMVRAERANDDDLAKELRPNRRVLVWILDQKEPEKGPLIWAMPWTLDRDIAKVSKDRRTGAHYVIDHPDEGYDVTFEKEGDQRTTKYTGVQISRKPSSVDSEPLEYIEGAPIPFTLKWREYDEIAKIFAASGMEDTAAPPRRDAPTREAPEREAPHREEPAAPKERFRPPPQREAEPERQAPSREREEAVRRNADLDDSPLPDAKPAARPEYTERGGGSSAADKAAALRARFGAKK